MAAPSGIVWGDIVKSLGRIGIYTSISNVDLDSTVTIQVWFWSKYSVSDSNNRFYFDNDTSTATTLIGDVTVKHTVSSGAGWSTENQTMIGKFSYTYTRTSAEKTIYCAAKLTGIDAIGVNGAVMYATTSYTIPSLPVYTISYNANGGSGAPSSQTKVHGSTITLSSTVPVRSGYDFLGWNSSSTATEATYSAGGSFTANRTVVLYAIWKAHTYSITYNANGGSNAPASQTKTHDISLSLSTSIPTRTNYNFLGWGVSPTATSIAYSPGAAYTANAKITLYAIWELAYTAPRITGISIFRSDSNGSALDYGTYVKIAFNWQTDKDISSISIQWKMASDSAWTTNTIESTGTSGSVNTVIGSGNISTETAYDVKVTVEDTMGYTTASKIIPGATYSIDILHGGKGVAIGKPAETANLFEVDFDSKFNDDIYDKYGCKITNGLTLYESEGIDPDTTLDHLILTNKNVPGNVFMYVKTEFYTSKTVTSNRMQTAFYYKQYGMPYFRYYFNNAWSDWTQFYTPVNNSANEHVTGGVWVDGKPIYRRIVTFSVSTLNENVTVSSPVITGFDSIVSITGTVCRTGTSVSYFPLTFYYSSTNYHNVWLSSTGNFTVRTSNEIECKVVVEYTKK